MRAGLLISVFAGLSGGLVGVLWGGLVSTRWLDGTTPQETVARLFAGAVLYATGGAVLGLLFFLGWGLVALVDAPWYAIGLLFGLLCWAGVALPAVGTLLLKVRSPVRIAVVHGVEWLVVCASVGLFCAYAWQRLA